jgi:hypothetical protein
MANQLSFEEGFSVYSSKVFPTNKHFFLVLSQAWRMLTLRSLTWILGLVMKRPVSLQSMMDMEVSGNEGALCMRSDKNPAES